jgi:hypothetical protein
VIAAGRLEPANQWDTAMIDACIDGTLYRHGLDIQRQQGFPNAPGCILVVPGRYWFHRYDAINAAVAQYDWLLLIVTSDEESLFNHGRITHPRLRTWVQTPRADRDYPGARLFGVGFTPHMKDLPAEPPDKTLDVYLSAQSTHVRRHQCFAALTQLPDHVSRDVTATEGFTQGCDPGEYAAQMAVAKVAPAPSGPACPDSFRAWEALAAHTLPILDDISPGYDSQGYWERILPGCPAPVLRSYESLPGYICEALAGWPANTNRITAWFMRYKRQLALNLREDLEALGAL